MQIASRLKKIRQICGWKQTSLALEMGITQQAYSCLEQGTGRYRTETLKRFCDVVNVDLPFLLSDYPITEETVSEYGRKRYSSIVSLVADQQKRIEVYEQLLNKNRIV